MFICLAVMNEVELRVICRRTICSTFSVSCLFTSFASLLLAGALFSGCASLSKMKKMASNVKYNVTPEVLEAHANIVDVKISVTIPPKYFNKKVTLVATPVLKFEGGEKAFDSKTLQGEKVQGNNTVVPYAAGKTISYVGKIAYKDAMRISDLEIRMVGSAGSKSLPFDAIKIADGVIATSLLVDNSPLNILAKDNFVRVNPESKEADLHYLINSSNIRWNEIKSEDISVLQDYLTKVKSEDNKKVTSFVVSSYASPDGKQDKNAKLADNRENSSVKFMKKALKKSNVEEFISAELLKTNSTPEDWAGFQKLMAASSIQDKELILRVLSMYSDPEVREREIKNIAATYTNVAKEILPQLRRSKFIVNVDVTGKSNDELKELAKSNPASLNVEELLRGASLLNGSDKLNAYTAATKQFSSDWRGFNDAGMELFSAKKIEDAKAMFVKADKLSANNAIVKNNLAAVELIKGNISQAEVLLGSATGAGEQVKYNKAIIAIKKANYKAAALYLNECNCLNSALANILSFKYTLALDKLNANTSKSAMVNYLKAIVGARTANNNLVISNLKTAIQKDASLKSVAKTDMEFVKLFGNADFKSIVD